MSLHTVFISNPIRPKSILTPFCFYKVEAHASKNISKVFAFCDIQLNYSHFELKLHPGTFTHKIQQHGMGRSSKCLGMARCLRG